MKETLRVEILTIKKYIFLCATGKSFNVNIRSLNNKKSFQANVSMSHNNIDFISVYAICFMYAFKRAHHPGGCHVI